MDRSRVELFGNRVITEQTLQSRYKTHIQRIKEIMNRKPGTSKTLNNRLAKANVKLVNVRYQFMREEFNDKAARENKYVAAFPSLIDSQTQILSSASHEYDSYLSFGVITMHYIFYPFSSFMLLFIRSTLDLSSLEYICCINVRMFE